LPALAGPARNLASPLLKAALTATWLGLVLGGCGASSSDSKPGDDAAAKKIYEHKNADAVIPKKDEE
jgi:hypothetical protein